MREEPRPTRRERRGAAVAQAAEFDGVLTLRRLGRLGYDHAAVSREVVNERWTRIGTHTVALHTGDVCPAALRWRAVWEVAESVALVDGVSALQAAGLTGYTEDVVHVSVPRGAQCPRVAGVRIHRVTPPSRRGRRRWSAAHAGRGRRTAGCGLGQRATGRRRWSCAWRCSSA